MKKRTWIIAGIAALVIIAAAWGPIVSRVEQAKYNVVSTHGAFEIRDYAPMVVAEVSVAGERKEAISNGFRQLADYIFGNNQDAASVAMTAPVMQQGQDIAMTAPVMQESTGQDAWAIRFMMPSSYTLKTLPRPNNDAISFHEVPAKRFAALRFSGHPDTDDLAARVTALNGFLQAQSLTAIGTPTYAFFNPPWTLPFLRRNEVMVEIEK